MLLLDEKRMRTLLKAFYSLTGMPMSVLDLSGRTVIGYPESTDCPFCRLMRAQPDFNAKCIACDEEHFQECRAAGKAVRYICHAGLTEMISPVQQNGVTLCYIQLGQTIMEESRDLTRMHIFHYSHEYFGVDGENLARDINHLSVISEEQFNAYQVLFESITLYLLSTQVVALSDTEFLTRLDDYIDSHIDQDIRISDLCIHFHMSRSRLYQYARSYLQLPLTTYIQNKRLGMAKEMLKKNDRSITDIAISVGFTNYSYFCRVFKQNTRLSPREYRSAKQKMGATAASYRE